MNPIDELPYAIMYAALYIIVFFVAVVGIPLGLDWWRSRK